MVWKGLLKNWFIEIYLIHWVSAGIVDVRFPASQPPLFFANKHESVYILGSPQKKKKKNVQSQKLHPSLSWRAEQLCHLLDRFGADVFVHQKELVNCPNKAAVRALSESMVGPMIGA